MDLQTLLAWRAEALKDADAVLSTAGDGLTLAQEIDFRIAMGTIRYVDRQLRRRHGTSPDR